MTETLNYQQLFEEQCEQNKKLFEQNQQQLKQNEQLQLLIQQLQQQIEQLLRAKFGKKSERQRKAPKAGEPKPKAPPLRDEEKVPGRELPASFPRVEVHHSLAGEQKCCSHCQNQLTEIKPLVREMWAYRPGSLYVKKHLRQRYACRNCQQTIITASMPIQPIEKGVADSSLLAQMIVDKYQDALPLYRQEQRWLRLGVALSRQTLCDWAIASSQWLVYLVNEIKKDILMGDKISSDDTTYPILSPGKTHTGRMWVYIGGGGNASPIGCVYEYTKTRSSSGPVNFLQGFQGYLQADAYSAYDKIYAAKTVIEVACWAHARRKFVDAYECGGEDKLTSLSQQAIDFIGQLYGIEKAAKLMTATARHYYRRRYAKPLLKKFHCWLKKTRLKAYPKSLLGKAIQYTLNHWRALINYCRDGRLDIDNNISERAMKPIVIGRKNYLFSGSHEGAKAAAIIYSIIETCKMWNVNTYDYLTDVLARLPNTLNKDIRQLLPYHWKPPTNN